MPSGALSGVLLYEKSDLFGALGAPGRTYCMIPNICSFLQNQYQLYKRVPQLEPILSTFMVILPKSTSVNRVPRIRPINIQNMVILLKSASITRVPQVQPMNT